MSDFKENNSIGDYEYWTMKEIFEQPITVSSTLNNKLMNNNINISQLNDFKDIIKEADNIIILGCGTSYHSGCMGLKYFRQFCNFKSTQVLDASEFNQHDIPKFGKTISILISQSGETKDVYECIKLLREPIYFCYIYSKCSRYCYTKRI